MGNSESDESSKSNVFVRSNNDNGPRESFYGFKKYKVSFNPVGKIANKTV